MKKSKIYTKGGDKGTTSLVGGQRVSKASSRLDAYGTVDELNSFIGNLRAQLDCRLNQDELLSEIQNNLFNVGAYLATDSTQPMSFEIPSGVDELDIQHVEQAIDELDDSLPKLNHFVIPAGGLATAASHMCHTITRRAERCIYQMIETIGDVEVDPLVLQYINRLSDYFFVLARATAHLEGDKEVFWEKKKR